MELFESIVFWILILMTLGILFWLAFGSPEFETSAITIGIFVATSEIMVWKAFFSIDKRTAVSLSSIDKRTAIGFERVRSEFREFNNRFGNMEKDISIIKENINEIKDNLIRKRK